MFKRTEQRPKRRLSLESLESRQLMSATPLSFAEYEAVVAAPALVGQLQPASAASLQAKDDSYRDHYTEFGNAVIIRPLANDQPAPSSHPSELRIVGVGEDASTTIKTIHGTVTILDRQSVVYKPNGNLPYNRDGVLIDSFRYTISDASGATSSAVVTVANYRTVRMPLHSEMSVTLDADTQISIPTFLNHTEQVIAVIPPRHGAVMLYDGSVHGPHTVPPNAFVVPQYFQAMYKPNQGYAGLDEFTMTLRNSTGLERTVQVSVTVVQPNRRPELSHDHVTVAPNQTVRIDVLANDRDPDQGDRLTVRAIVGGPQHGAARIDPATQQIVYTPKSGYTGPTDRFTYEVIDSGGLTARAEVRITFAAPKAEPPSNLAAGNTWARAIDLKWQDNSRNESGFVIERSTDGKNFQVIGTVGANVTKFRVTDLSPDTRYWFRVRAETPGGRSAPTDTLMVRTKAEAPAAPTGLMTRNVWATKIDLGWTDRSSNETGFIIEMSRDGKSWQQVDSTAANAKSFRVTGLKSNTVYHFRVVAVTNGVRSAVDSTLTVRTARA